MVVLIGTLLDIGGKSSGVLYDFLPVALSSWHSVLWITPALTSLDCQLNLLSSKGPTVPGLETLSRQ